MATKKRRPKGEGSVYYDKSRQRWVGQLSVNGRRRKVSGKDKTEVRAKLAKLAAVKHTGGQLIDQRRTVTQCLDTFLERALPNRTGQGDGLAPSTLAAYQWSANVLKAEIGKIRVAALTVQDIEAMFDRLANRKHKPMSAGSLKRIRSTLSGALTFAERRGEALRNVAAYAEITPTASRSRERRSFTPDQARAFLSASDDGTAEGHMLALQLRIGLRPGEAAGLYWEDIEDAAVNVTRAAQTVAKGRVEITHQLKTKSAKRTILLPDEMAQRLAAHRQAQLQQRLAAAWWSDENLVFTTRYGTPIDPRQRRRALKRICETAGLPVLSPNELRHSCASLLSDIGVPNEEIADLLGHTTTRMVDQTYRHRLRPVVDVAAKADWAAEG